MEKMKDNAPGFELNNSLSPNKSPIGYPDMKGKNPISYVMGEPSQQVIFYNNGKLSHSSNPESPQKYKGASADELKRMKLSK